MIKLAILLIGGQVLRRRWRVLVGLGLIWLALGFIIMIDGADGVSLVATRTFAGLLVVEGGFALVAFLGADFLTGRFQLTKALALIVLGFMILDWPFRVDIANSLLFGLAFLIDGGARIVTAYVVRYPRWQLSVAGGALEIALGIFAVAGWPMTYHRTVPVTVGLLVALSGWSAVRIGVMLKNLPETAPVTTLPLFGPRRQRGEAMPDAISGGAWDGAPNGAPDGAPQTGTPDPAEVLTVHIWTPLGSAKGAHGAPILNRYIAAIDRRGRISTGHAALELGPDIYVSHYPAVEIERSPDQFSKVLRAGIENDVPGRFQPSYRYEADDWCEADRHVVFRRFDAAKLRSHWAAYSLDDTYNLTDRNCSVSVAVALDAALEGVLGGKRPWRRFLKLLGSPDLWLAAMVRARAEAMTWTPGLVLDYAQALKAVVEPSEETWRTRLVRAWRRVRKLYRAEALGVVNPA